jgi:hypothetical protein
MPRPFLILSIVWLTLLCPGAAWAQSPNLPIGTRFIMSHFRIDNNDVGSQVEKLFISVSPDGLNWTTLNGGNPVWAPPGYTPFYDVVRDPSIVYANGFYWVAYTSGAYGQHAKFALVRSPDLINWTHVTDVSTLLPDAYAPFTWGPFFFQDTDGSVHVFVSIGEQVDRNTGQPIFDLRTYEVHPLNAEFTQWSAPVMVQAPSNRINEFWVWREGETYHAMYVDFNDSGQYVHVTSNNLITGWTNRKLVGLGSLEGCFVLKRPEGGYRVHVEGAHLGHFGYRFYDYDDEFRHNGSPAVYFNSPVTMRNGKVMLVPAVHATTTYGHWRDALLNSQPLALRAPMADPDLDGLSNLVECSMGLPPLEANYSPFQKWRDADGKFRLRNYRLPGLVDVSQSLEMSGDPISWQDATSMSLRSRTMMTDGRQLLEWAQTGPSPGSLLLRVGANLAP